MQNCKFYIGKLNLHLIIFDPSVWSFSMHPPMWPQDLGRNVRGGFWKYWFSIYFVPLSAVAQSAKICCWSWLPQYFLLKRWPNGEVNESRTRYERDPMIPKYKMFKDILLEELLHSKIARASLPRISACTCLKMNVMVKYRNKMKKSCSAYAFHKRIIQKLVDNRYAQKCCSAYAFSQKARLNQIPNQHANISKSCNEARLSPLPVAGLLGHGPTCKTDFSPDSRQPPSDHQLNWAPENVALARNVQVTGSVISVSNIVSNIVEGHMAREL